MSTHASFNIGEHPKTPLEGFSFPQQPAPPSHVINQYLDICGKYFLAYFSKSSAYIMDP